MRKWLQPFFTFIRWLICHFEYGRTFTSWYKKRRSYRIEQRKIRRLHRHGVKILNEIYTIFQRENITYYAEYGTLLGTLREHNFIAHDNDIDFGLLPDSVEPSKLMAVLLKNGYRFHRGFAYEGVITELCFLRYGISVDFFFRFNDSNDPHRVFGFWYGEFDVDMKTGIGKANRIGIGDRPPFGPLMTIQMENKAKVVVPQNGADFLTYSYGDWQTHRRGFNGVDRNKHRDLIKGDAKLFIVKEALAEVATRKTLDKSPVDFWRIC